MKCKATDDPLFGKGEKVGENMYRSGHTRHFFTTEYMRENLKDFEIYRSIAGDYFQMIMAGRFFTYADTSIAWYFPEDSLQLLKYAVVPIGIDRYRGQSSDTLTMYMKKKK